MRKAVLYTVLVLELLLVVSLGRGLWETLQSRGRVDALREREAKLLQEQDRLYRELSNAESDYYIEQIARNQLHLTKPGETLVLVDEGAIPTILGDQDTQDVDTRKNWEKWWDVLFGSEL